MNENTQSGTEKVVEGPADLNPKKKMPFWPSAPMCLIIGGMAVHFYQESEIRTDFERGVSHGKELAFEEISATYGIEFHPNPDIRKSVGLQFQAMKRELESLDSNFPEEEFKPRFLDIMKRHRQLFQRKEESYERQTDSSKPWRDTREPGH